MVGRAARRRCSRATDRTARRRRCSRSRARTGERRPRRRASQLRARRDPRHRRAGRRRPHRAARASSAADPRARRRRSARRQAGAATRHRRAAIAPGLALVPEDRAHAGHRRRPVASPTTSRCRSADAFPSAGGSTGAHAARAATSIVKALNAAVTPATWTSAIGALSGGNQQKVVLGKWLPRKPRVAAPRRADARHRRRRQGGDLPHHRRARRGAASGSSWSPRNCPSCSVSCDRADRAAARARSSASSPGSATEEEVIALSMLHAPAPQADQRPTARWRLTRCSTSDGGAMATTTRLRRKGPRPVLEPQDLQTLATLSVLVLMCSSSRCSATGF